MRENLVDNDYFVHESSYVDEPCEIGHGTKIWHFSHVMCNCRIGYNCNIGQNVVISPEVIIGNNVKIQNNVSLYTGVICEDDVFIGPSAVFTNVVNPRSHINRKNEYRRTVVKKGSSIGANATIVCGHNIGRYAFIGAGAVITKDIPDFALAVGNPARIVGWICQCGVRLQYQDIQNKSEDICRLICNSCGSIYLKQNSLVIENPAILNSSSIEKGNR